MDHKLRKLYEQMTSRQSSVHNSEQNKYKSLSLVYEREVLSPSVSLKPHEPAKQEISNSSDQRPTTTANLTQQNISNEDKNFIKKITGHTSDEDVNEFYSLYNNKKENIKKDEEFIENEQKLKESKVVYITIPTSSPKKLRCGKAIGQKSAETLFKWTNAKSSVGLKKCLLVFYIYKELTNSKMPIVETEAAGIEAEMDNVNKFNEVVAANNGESVALLFNNKKILFDKARKPGKGEGIYTKPTGKTAIAAQPKSDLILSNKGESVFWISLKESQPGTVNIRQWGSPVTIYNDYGGIAGVIDLFLTKSINEINLIKYSSDDLKDPTKYNFVVEQVVKRNKVFKKTVDECKEGSVSYIFLWPEATYTYSKIIPDTKEGFKELKEEPNTTLLAYSLLTAYKGIYGMNFDPEKDNQKFGVENVQMVIETLDLRFKQTSTSEIEIVEDNNCHIFANPNLPNSGPYEPYLYNGYAKGQKMYFKYNKQDNQSCILFCRPLIYPAQKARSGRATEIKLWE